MTPLYHPANCIAVPTSSAAPLVPELPLPRSFGPYTLFDRIGKGGMAEIFLARTTTELGGSRLVVVKQILPHLANTKSFADLLVAEAKLAARLNHANVVQILDLGREDDVLYIAMQYVEGFDLNDLLRLCARTKTPMPIEYALLVVIEMLRALDYAHRRMSDDGIPLGIVHRDVSPSNVLISFEGEIKLCDFGIARANDAAEVLPEDAIKGKAGYMSPEHARGDKVDARADLFAAGIVLWELLAGRRLYRAGAGAGPTLLDLAREANIPELPARGLRHEEELHTIVAKALAREADDRYPNAQAMLRDLEAYVVRAGLLASPIKLGDWLMDHFGEELVEQRRARERAAKAIAAGPVATISAIQPLEAIAAEEGSASPQASSEQRDPEAAPPAEETSSVSLVSSESLSESPADRAAGSKLWLFVAIAAGLLALGAAGAMWLR